METAASAPEYNRAPNAAASPASAAYSLDYAGLPVAHTPPWGWLTVVDVLCNNIALGLYLAAAVGMALLPGAFGAVAAPAFLLAWLLILLDLVLLIFDLGDPARFHHMLRTVRPASPMWVGVWALSLCTLFMLPAALWGALRLLAAAEALPQALISVLASPAVHTALLASLAPGALCAAAGVMYKGVLFSATSRPVWKDARWFPAYVASGSVLLGCAALAGLGLLLHDARAAHALFPAMLALLALDILGLELHLRPLLRLWDKAPMAKALRTASLMDGLAFTCLLALWLGSGSAGLMALGLGCILTAAILGRACFLQPG